MAVLQSGCDETCDARPGEKRRDGEQLPEVGSTADHHVSGEDRKVAGDVRAEQVECEEADDVGAARDHAEHDREDAQGERLCRSGRGSGSRYATRPWECGGRFWPCSGSASNLSGQTRSPDGFLTVSGLVGPHGTCCVDRPGLAVVKFGR